MSCQKTVPQTDCMCQKRPLVPHDQNDSGNTFYVDISNYSSVAVKYRVPLNNSQPETVSRELFSNLQKYESPDSRLGYSELDF